MVAGNTIQPLSTSHQFTSNEQQLDVSWLQKPTPPNKRSSCNPPNPRVEPNHTSKHNIAQRGTGGENLPLCSSKIGTTSTPKIDACPYQNHHTRVISGIPYAVNLPYPPKGTPWQNRSPCHFGGAQRAPSTSGCDERAYPACHQGYKSSLPSYGHCSYINQP